MADIWNIISSNYVTVGGAVPSNSKYVAVDPEKFEGSWKGKYANGTSFDVSISNVNGFRAKAKYQYGTTIKYQDVLIKNNSFRVGDSKFVLKGKGTAQVSTVMTDAATGASSLETAYVHQS